jgi:hypothetical protein
MKFFFNFLWQFKVDKLRRKLVIQVYANGGLKNKVLIRDVKSNIFLVDYLIALVEDCSIIRPFSPLLQESFLAHITYMHRNLNFNQ